MKNILNQLIQLQELHFALAERHATNSPLPLNQLEEAIAKIQKTLPEDIATRYPRLQQRFPQAVVPVTRGNCAGCGLAIPHATINAVTAGEQVYNCPHCGRFLYVPETVAKRPKQPMSSNRPVVTGVARFSSPSLMVPKLTAATSEEAIRELAGIMAAQGFVENGDVVAELALKREAVVSTALGNGLAVPHTREMEGGGLAFAVGLKAKGLAFGSADGKLTKIVFLVVIPSAASAFYLRLLAGIVKTFDDADSRKALLEAETPEDMWKTLAKLTRATIP